MWPWLLTFQLQNRVLTSAIVPRWTSVPSFWPSPDLPMIQLCGWANIQAHKENFTDRSTHTDGRRPIQAWATYVCSFGYLFVYVLQNVFFLCWSSMTLNELKETFIFTKTCVIFILINMKFDQYRETIMMIVPDCYGVVTARAFVTVNLLIERLKCLFMIII